MCRAHEHRSDGQHAAAAAQVQHRAVFHVAERVRGVQYQRRKVRAWAAPRSAGCSRCPAPATTPAHLSHTAPAPPWAWQTAPRPPEAPAAASASSCEASSQSATAASLTATRETRRAAARCCYALLKRSDDGTCARVAACRTSAGRPKGAHPGAPLPALPRASAGAVSSHPAHALSSRRVRGFMCTRLL